MEPMTENRDAPPPPARDATDDAGQIQWIEADQRRIALIGTAHVSRQSTELVRRVIASVKPDTVCVELCASRFQNLRQADRWRNTDVVRAIREKKAPLLLASLLLSAFQRRIASQLEVEPGAEMLAAIEAAEAIGARVVLADRDIRTTLRRTWRAMGLRDRLRMTVQLIGSLAGIEEIDASAVERMKQEDVLEGLLADMGRDFPEVRRTLIDERDEVLAERIRSAPGRTIVAVVGAGHVPGIRRRWDAAIDMAELERVPVATPVAKAISWIVPLALVGLLAGGFAWGGMRTGSHMLGWWALVTGALAGLGAVAALAHPVTVAAAVLAAPLTTLHPLIAAGWVSGLVEAVSRRPRVRDIEDLPRDILSVRGFWRNGITRVLLVVVFTNLGATLGTLVAIPMMLRMLG
jgi:pheromone shutdown-related protein TraB